MYRQRVSAKVEDGTSLALVEDVAVKRDTPAAPHGTAPPPPAEIPMRNVLLASTAALLASATAAAAQTQTVGVEVAATSQLSFAGAPSLLISSAVAGAGLTSASSSAGTYSITTNESDRKITAELNADMPSGITLTASVAAPTGATSAGPMTLSTTAATVVTGIATVNQGGLPITYGLAATVSAGVMAATTRVVTYTVIAGS